MNELASEFGDDRRIRELSLFTGAGGGILGSRLLGHRIVCAVEYEPYCIEILRRRQEEGHLEAFPIWDDIRTFDGKPWRGKVDCVSAGFPCQAHSVAGKREGADDERNMWPDTIRITREVSPGFVFLENVPGLLSSMDHSADEPVSYFGTILGDLAESGYDCRWDCISAAAVGAPHKRSRLWVVAQSVKPTTRSEGGERRDKGRGTCENRRTGVLQGEREVSTSGPRTAGEDVADASVCRRSDGGCPERDNGDLLAEIRTAEEGEQAGRGRKRWPGPGGGAWWDADPADIPDTGRERIHESGEHGTACEGRHSNGREEGDVLPCGEGEEGQELPDSTGRGQDGRRGDVRGDGSVPADPEAGRSGEREEGNGSREGGRAQPGMGSVVDEFPGGLDFSRTAFGGQVPRVATGVRNRVDRLKALGNAQVPLCVATAWRLLTEA